MITTDDVSNFYKIGFTIFPKYMWWMIREDFPDYYDCECPFKREITKHCEDELRIWREVAHVIHKKHGMILPRVASFILGCSMEGYCLLFATPEKVR